MCRMMQQLALLQLLCRSHRINKSSDTMHNPEYTDLFGESMEFSPDVDPVLLNWDPNHTPVSVKRELSESPIRRRHRGSSFATPLDDWHSKSEPMSLTLVSPAKSKEVSFYIIFNNNIMCEVLCMNLLIGAGVQTVASNHDSIICQIYIVKAQDDGIDWSKLVGDAN